MKTIRAKTKGFTPIELLIVVAIAAILAAIIIPQIQSYKKYVSGTKVLIEESPTAPETKYSSTQLKRLGR